MGAGRGKTATAHLNDTTTELIEDDAMSSKAQRRAIKKANNAAQGMVRAPRDDLRVITGGRSEITAQPTPERRAIGVWHTTKDGTQDMAHDMIGRLSTEGKLNSQQVESARVFQETRAAYVAELGTVGYRSCLAGGSGGYDSGDGNPEAIRAYRKIENAVGPKHIWMLRQECDKLANDRPWSIDGLREALDAMGA